MRLGEVERPAGTMLWTLLSLTTVSAFAAPPLILSNLTTLRHTRARIVAGDASLRRAVQLLRKDAEAAMHPQFWTEGAGPWSSVVATTHLH